MVSKRARGLTFIFVAIGITLLVFGLIPFSNDVLPDYKNMKFEIGFTPNDLPTPHKTGGPQNYKAVLKDG